MNAMAAVQVGESVATAQPLDVLLARSRAAFAARGGAVSYADRIDALKKLEQAIHDHRIELAQAINADFKGRAMEETLALEVFGLLDEIRYTRKQLKKWMKPKRVPTNALFRPSQSRIHYQPLGVIGVMGAFNYPLHLTISPMVGAIAAGNHVMAKPSELSPHLGAALKRILAAVFPEDYICVVVGDGEVSKAFAKLPFNHLLFTGSTRVGRLVMKEAAEHLTPVTLELGGKSPAIVCDDYPLKTAVEDICHAKLLNGGQTCIAPDHVFVPEARKEEFLRLAREVIKGYYPSLVANPDYTRVISARDHQRLTEWVEEAKSRGAKVEIINPANENCDTASQVFPPTLVTDCPDDARLIRNEIFGPVLPVLTYRSLDEVIGKVNAGAHPLALYCFSHDRRSIDKVLAQTLTGGVTINGCIYHIGQHNLPFGGVGDSGMGQYHGFHGFETFSKKKAVFHTSRLLAKAMLRPPFGRPIQWVLGLFISGRLRREQLPHKP